MSPRRRLVLLAAVVLAAVLAGIAVVAVARDGSDDAPAAVTADQRPGPVLLVPGYGGSTTALTVLADRLRAGGRDATVVALPGEGTGDLTASARVLDEAARGAVDDGAGSVDVVGYSAGGVVARIWADELGGSSLARRIVTLGAPHAGTEVAALGAALLPDQCPEACRQLVPGSDLLDGLPAVTAGPVWTSIWTAADEVVTPPQSAVLAGALSIRVQDVCPDATTQHGQLPTDPLVEGLVLRALGPEPLTRVPAASECAAVRAG